MTKQIPPNVREAPKRLKINKTPVKVSVSITTYNHEPFIEQAIESVLMQRTNFEYEILIGEDDSSDRTRDIVKQYQTKYPEKIKLFLNERSNVIYINGRPTGRWNFVNNLNHATGEYIALLDGDDYWTSPHKLQTQVDFLENKPNFSFSFHNALVIYEDKSHPSHPFNPPQQKSNVFLKDILKKNFIATSSVMLRRSLLSDFPDWYLQIPFGDWPLYILMAQYGHIGYLNEAMSVYRIHSKGLWSNRSPTERVQAKIQFYEQLKILFKNQYEDVIDPILASLHNDLDKIHLEIEPKKTQTTNDPDTDAFLNPPLNLDNMDRYLVRTAILGAIKDVLPTLFGTLLDIGCGEMPYKPILLGESSRVTQYIGLDIENPDYQQHVKPDMFWNGTQIGLPDKSIDCAIATEVLEHVPEPDQVLAEIYRVLKPGGIFFFTVPFLWPLHDIPYDEYRYTPFAMQRLLKNTGFDQVNLKSLGGWDASLAQMIGLWINRRPMLPQERAQFAELLFPFYQNLVSSDERPHTFDTASMITGLSGVATKLPKDNKINIDNRSQTNIETAIQILDIASERKITEKIIIVTEAFPTVTETFILDQITGLIDRGANIEIWAVAKPTQNVIHQDIIEYELLKRTKYIKYPTLSEATAEEWTKTFLEINHISDFDHITAFHIHFGPTFNQLAPLFAVHSDKFVLVSFHGYDASKYFDIIGDDCYDDLFRRADLITTPSYSMKNNLVKKGATVEKIVVHRYGVDLKRFRSKTSITQNGSIRLLTVGRMVPKKGIEYSIRAFAEVVREYDAVYKIIGEGPLDTYITKLIEDLKIQDKVIVETFTNKSGIIAEMMQADVFVLTSITASDNDQEGVPVSLIEAHAMGLPVISTFHAGIPELVTENKTGLLAPEKDIKIIAQHMRKLISDKQFRLTLSRNARQRVETDFDIEILNDRLWHLLTSQDATYEAVAPLASYHVPNTSGASNSNQKSISIVIPTYNRAKFLPQAIASTLAQIRPADEILIVDDGSTDNTNEVVQAFDFPNIRYIHKDHTGAPATRNRGILEATGDFILWLDSDDILGPKALSRYHQMLENYPDADIVYCQLQSIDTAGNNTHLYTYHDWYANQQGMLSFLMIGSPVPNGGTLIRKKVFAEVGLYNTEFKRAHDYEFWSRVALTQHYKAKYVEEILYYYRIHDSNITGHLNEHTDYQYEQKILSNLLNNVPLETLLPNLDWSDSARLAKAEAFFYIATKYFGWNNAEEGLRYLSESVGLHPVPERMNFLAVQLAQRGELQEAHKILHEAYRRAPTDRQILENLHIIHTEMSKVQTFQQSSQVGNTNANAKFANICMVTFNRVEFTKQAIDSITKHTSYPYVLTVVDNNSSDGTQAYLRQLHSQGIIKNLILLPENMGVAKASNIAWRQESQAEYYVKYDNDIIIQKPDWLSKMADMIENMSQIGVVGYNFEPQSYPLVQLNGRAVRPKSNLGGACILIPKRTEQLLGYWCEEYGLYGEEDADYGVRVQLAGLQNAYMEDEDIGLHLPAGKAAKIDPITLVATDGLEEDEHKEYRLWKDEQRRQNVLKGKYKRILSEYQKGIRPLFVEAGYYKTWWLVRQNQKPLTGDSKQPNTDTPTHTTKKISIIIPVFNKVEFTQKCLEAIHRNTLSSLYLEIIVVNNGSTDNTSGYLNEASKQYPDLRIVHNANNLGFAKACNQGVLAASGDYLLFLNNDTQVQPGWLEPLIKVLDSDPTVAAVGSRLLYPDGTIQHAGVTIFDDRQSIDPLLAQHEHQRKPGDGPEVNQMRTYQALTAACLLVRNSAFQAVGGFDEGYWNGYEDVDLCFKFQEHDWRLVYQPESVIIHYESQSGPERFKRVQHNIERLHEKWLAKIRPDFIIQSDGSRVPTKTNFILPYSFPTDSKNLASEQGLTSIIILTHNQLEHTKLCLNSIESHTPQPHELIIVDNGSADGTLDYLRTYEAEHDNVHIIANTGNRGFAAGNNQGLAAAKGDYILLLNNDTIVTESWLARMLEVFNRYSDVGIVGPVSNYVSGLQLVREAAYQNLEEMHQFATNWAIEHTGQTMEIYRVVGFCLLARREVIDRIGGLDERFGTGNFEDDDFCIRAALAGFKARIAQDVFIHHTGNQTFKEAGIDYHQSMQRNWELFKAKWDIPPETSLEAGYQLSLEAFNSEQYFIPLPAETKNDRSKTTETSSANTLILFAHEKASTQRLTYCLENLERYHSSGEKLAVKVVNPPTDLSLTSNQFDLNEAIENTPTAALHATLNSGEPYAVLLAADVTITKNWLDRLIAIADSDPTIAAIGPTSNAAPTPQQIKKGYRSLNKDLQTFAAKRANKYGHTWEEVAYLGGFCLLLKSHQVRVVGGLDDSLPLSEALWDLYQRLQQYGFKLVCAQGVYVHHRRLTEQEGATYDAFANTQQAAAKVFAAGERALEQGDLDTAIEIFTQMTKQFPYLTAGYTALGSTLLALDRCQEATPHLQQAALLSPRVSAIHNQLGIALYQSGQQAEAEAAFQEARRLDPTDVQPLLNLIDLHRAGGDYVAATEMLKAALSLTPDHPDVLVAFGMLSLELGDIDGAQQALQHLREAPPDHPGIIALQQAVGSCQLPDAQTKSAVESREPDSSTNLEEIRSRVAIAQAQENWSQAIELLQDTLKQEVWPEDEAYLWNSLGYCYVKANLPAEAEISFKQGLETTPNHLHLLSNLADLYLQQERFDQATEYLNRALAVDPDDTNILLSLGQCCIQLSVFDTALLAFRRVQALAPETEGIDQVVTELETLVLVPV